MNAESFDPPSLEALASLLPGYDFEAFIAQGGMGAVYKARQRSLDRDVAIKILPRELGEDPEFHRSFATEAKAMARLNHPNLIGVYDFGDADGMPYIVMEYVNGKSLFHSAHNLAVDPRQAVTIVKGICDGLAHAHENGVIHRDIKPANILLTPKAEPKVGDFGLARPAGEDSTGLLMGTPGYTAPEVIRQPDHADRRSDIFALGVVLYELLIGRCPPYDVPPPPPSTIVGCDPALDAICAIATHPSADMRYPSAGAMSAALDQWLRGANRVPPPGTTATISHKPARPPRPVAEAAPIVVKSRGSSSFVTQAAILAVLIVISAIAWKKLKGMEAERDADEAAYNASKANPAAAAEPPEKPTPSAGTKPQPEPSIPDPENVPEEATEPEVATADPTGPTPMENTPDKPSAEEVATAEPEPEPEEVEVEMPPAVVELETKAKSLLTTLDKECAAELAANAKALRSELDSWLRVLSKSEQVTWKPHVERLKQLAVKDRVPTQIDSDSGIGLTERMAKIADFAARKQKLIDETYDAKAVKIRDGYVSRLADAAKSAEGPLKEAINERAEEAADLDSWIVAMVGESTLVATNPLATGGGPASIAGKWISKTSNATFTFDDDGTCKASHGDVGKWTKKKKKGPDIRYVINWNSGYIDQLLLEGEVLTGTNNHGETLRLERSAAESTE